MSRRVAWTRPALNDMQSLARAIAVRIRRAVQRLAESGHGDVRKLQGTDREWRLRVGSWRVRLTFEGDAVVVYRVFPRDRAYR